MKNSADSLFQLYTEQFNQVMLGTKCTDKEGKSINLELGLQRVTTILKKLQESKHSVYIVGNGGSAATASHIITDFINMCNLRTFVLHESSLVTCMSNDYGYEHAYERLIGIMMNPGDVLIAISSSGQSMNIHRAVKQAQILDGVVVTFSGFKADNILRQLGDINLWLDSNSYGFVEIGHLFLLHHLAEKLATLIHAKSK